MMVVMSSSHLVYASLPIPLPPHSLPSQLHLTVPHSSLTFPTLTKNPPSLHHFIHGCRSTSIKTSFCSTTPNFPTSVAEQQPDINDAAAAAAEFVVVNFYHLVFLQDPQLEVARHSAFVQGLDIHGRIYLNEQGINAQFSGQSRDTLEYVEWIKEDPRFSDILVQVSPSSSGHAFPRLKLRYKPNLVQFDIEAQDLPLLEPSMRATPLSPYEWRKRLNSLNNCHGAENGNQTKSCILLDVRNGYEWDIGHFDGAQRPEVDCFKSTSFGLSDVEVIDSDPLVNIDKDKTEILMYCTGGIRCDVYSTILRQKGFKNLYTLKGGVSHYLAKEGSEKWKGNLFVFDSRLSLPPSAFKPGTSTSREVQDASAHSAFARCYLCGSQVHELRHRNCANIDCNLLFLCCEHCVEELRGCCCLKCTTASRLRPILSGNERYNKWHVYRDGKVEQTTFSL